jgi:hypothetical protein
LIAGVLLLLKSFCKKTEEQWSVSYISIFSFFEQCTQVAIAADPAVSAFVVRASGDQIRQQQKEVTSSIWGLYLETLFKVLTDLPSQDELFPIGSAKHGLKIVSFMWDTN